MKEPLKSIFFHDPTKIKMIIYVDFDYLQRFYNMETNPLCT